MDGSNLTPEIVFDLGYVANPANVPKINVSTELLSGFKQGVGNPRIRNPRNRKIWKSGNSEIRESENEGIREMCLIMDIYR